MEKESLYIYKLDGQGDKVKFPNANMPSRLGEYTYSAQRMSGTPTLTATLNYPSCLDDFWTGEEFVEFRGERYYVDQVPTSSKDNKSVMYKHELQFVSERIVLENVYFLDVVTAGADTYHSNSTSVKFMGDINEFVGRLNASMTKSGIGYSVVIDEGITSDSKLVSLENTYIADAMQSIYTTYGLPYYFVGKVCHVGYTENVISTTFEYREGLVSIKKTNANYKIVNRVTGTGSSDNIPFYYPNDDETGTIERAQNLMPYVYRQTNGAERFYNALNGTYKTPGSEDYYSFTNTYSAKKVKEIKVDFDDIKPTIEGVTNASGQLFGEIADIAFDENDSDELGTGTGDNVFNGTDEYVHSYFYIKLHVYDGDYGFNLFEQGLEGGTAVINMTTGNCAACEFEIGVTYKDGDSRAYNPVLVDSSGNLPAGDFEQKVTSDTSKYVARQQDTSANEVWVAVKKDNASFGVVMPNATNNYKPSVGDKFVITGIKMPKSLVIAAEKRLEESLIKYMSENNDEKFTFSVSFSRIFLANNSDVANLLNENARIYIKYNGRQYLMYVSSFTCKADKNCLYDISVELTDSLSANVSALRSTITEIAGDIIGEKLGDTNNADLLAKIGAWFLRKNTNDRTPFNLNIGGKLTAEKSLQIGKDFVPGIETGVGGFFDQYANGELESLVIRRFLEVPELRFNRAEIVLGDKWRSPGAGIIESVEYDRDGDGNLLRSGTITLKLEEGEIGAVAVDDICMGYFHDYGTQGNNASSDADDSRGNRMFAGFCTIYFRVTEILDTGTNKRFKYALRGVSDRWQHSFHPCEALHFVAYGNFTDTERQTSAYETRTYGRFLTGVNDWEFTKDMVAMQFGDLGNLNVFGLDMTGYSAYLNNIYMTGTIEQFHADAPVRIEIDTQGDNFLAYGESMTITCKVFRGWEDITGTVTQWGIRRDSGDTAEDDAWNINHKDFDGTITIYNTSDTNDLGNNSLTTVSTLFTITATNQTESAEATVTI